MRRCACITMLLTLCWLAIGSTASAQTIQISHSRSVVAASDSSGVSITIEQTGTSPDDTDGTLTVIVESGSDDGPLVCSLDPGSAGGSIEIHGDGTIEVIWAARLTDQISIALPSIRIAGLLTNFDCEPTD